MELLICGKCWGLPSIDPEDLLALSYCRFAEVPVKIKATNWGGTGRNPGLKKDSNCQSGANNIIQFLKEQEFDIDMSLGFDQKSDLLAYTCLVQTKLSIALQHDFWLDSKNYCKITHPSWNPFLCFMSTFPVKQRGAVEKSLRAKYQNEDITLSECGRKIITEGKECLNTLSYKLGNNKYFFGDKPTSLDAHVFSRLAYLMYVPFPSSSLQTHAKACPNLVKYCQRILKEFFPAAEISRLEKEEAKESMKLEKFPNCNRNIVLAIGIAAILVAAITMDLLCTVVGKTKIR